MSYLPLLNFEEKKNSQIFAWWPVNFNTPNYKEHIIEYFNQIFFFKKDIPVFFIYEKYTLSIDFYVKKMTSYLF